MERAKERLMQSGINLPETDPLDVAIAPTDEDIARVYRPYMRAMLGDGQPAAEREMAHDANRHASVAELLNVRSATRNRGWVLPGFVALVSAAIIGVPAILLLSPYREAAKLMTAGWVSPPSVTSPAVQLNQPPLQLSSAPDRADATKLALAPAVSDQYAQQEAAATSLVLSPEQTRLLETMPRDLANLEQRIEQLNARQEQLSRDNAKLLEELEANKERTAQTAAENAKVIAKLEAGHEELARAIATASDNQSRRANDPSRHLVRRSRKVSQRATARPLLETESAPAIVQPLLVPRAPAPLL
jgi:hypothetical protein